MMVETVVAAWVLIAGGYHNNYPKFSAEFSTRERCESAAKEVKSRFSDSHVAFCVQK